MEGEGRGGERRIKDGVSGREGIDWKEGQGLEVVERGGEGRREIY